MTEAIETPHDNPQQYISFWDVQPVDVCNIDNPLPGKILDTNEVNERISPFTGFSFKSMDKNNNEDLEEITNFIQDNYVEDAGNTARLHYKRDFFKWFLSSDPKWNLAIVSDIDQSIVGFIAAVKKNVKLVNENVDIAEINFLCVQKSFRHRRIAPLLINEITTRVNESGLFTAIHTSSAPLPHVPFFTATYYHKYFNVTNLHNSGYIHLPNLKKGIQVLQHKSSVSSYEPGDKRLVVRPLHKKERELENDISFILKLQSQENNVAVSENWNRETIHSMLNQTFLDLFIVEQIDPIECSRKPVGFISTFNTDYLMLKSRTLVKQSQLYYTFGETCQAMESVFSILQKGGTDLFTVLSGGANQKLIKNYKFLSGTGKLHYYMFNYRLSPLHAEQVRYITV